jgi:hypothetical protein
MLYYPPGTTDSDHFYSPDGKFLTVSLTLETNERLLEKLNFFEYSTDFNDDKIARCLAAPSLR